MLTIPQARFTDFLNDIEPSPTTKNDASSAHTTLRNFLKNEEDFKGYHEDTFLSGSYKRNTAIRPQKREDETERPDVDIIVETNHTREDAAEEVIDLLYNTLAKKYTEIRRQDRSVGIETSQADMDVVPVIKHDGIYFIPDRKLGIWLPTNPPGHTTWTTETNKTAGKRFKPLVKLTKWWRRENPTSDKKPKGFVIECFVAYCMDYVETYYGELFVQTLEAIVEKYEWYTLFRRVPSLPDPGIQSNSVTDGMMADAFIDFYNKAKEHAELGRKALNETDPEKATELWQDIFGDRFPKTEGTKSESLLAAPVTLSSSTFPNEPIVPKEPKGFA
ncbi:MAG: nucleotidyltransferase [Candidatus Poribacteria bacterium]|nr:nucleotidyltransferase [Candidatus Poribacteria bacterium]